jgi:hypothetical protein
MEKEAHITLRLEKRQLAQLQKIAKQEDVSVSWLIRKAIERLLKEKS